MEVAAVFAIWIAGSVGLMKGWDVKHPERARRAVRHAQPTPTMRQRGRS